MQNIPFTYYINCRIAQKCQDNIICIFVYNNNGHQKNVKHPYFNKSCSMWADKPVSASDPSTGRPITSKLTSGVVHTDYVGHLPVPSPKPLEYNAGYPPANMHSLVYPQKHINAPQVLARPHTPLDCWGVIGMFSIESTVNGMYLLNLIMPSLSCQPLS